MIWAEKMGDEKKQRKQRQKYPRPTSKGCLQVEACRKLGYKSSKTIYRLLDRKVLEDYCYYKNDRRYLILEPPNLPILAEKIKENIQYKKSNIRTNNYDDDQFFGF